MGRNALKTAQLTAQNVEQELGEALSAVAASVLPCSLTVLVLRSPLGWKNTQTSVTRSQLWWEALAEIQPCAAFGLGSSQSRAGFVHAQPLTQSSHGPKTSRICRGRGQRTWGMGIAMALGPEPNPRGAPPKPTSFLSAAFPGALGAHGGVTLASLTAGITTKS